MGTGKSQRARGGNRGGCGGGYEQTDPEWDNTRIRTLRAEYDSLDPQWKDWYLKSLSKLDRYHVVNRDPR